MSKRIKTKRLMLLSIALLILAALMFAGLNIIEIEAKAAVNSNLEHETPYSELVPVLEKNIYQASEQINVSFVLDSQFELVTAT